MTIGGKPIDLSRGVMPIVAAFALMVLVATASFTVGSVFTGMQTEANQFRTELTAIQTSLAEIRTQVATLQASMPAQSERWSRADHVRFCWAAERANPAWKCPAME